jgi:hypothetical protein
LLRLPNWFKGGLGICSFGHQVEPPSYTFDRDRLEALAQFAILDTPPERGFDDIVELAAYICDTPVALVSFVSHDRQWFKARFGLSECQTDLNSSVCQHALIEPDLLVVGDLSLDERTRANPLVVGAPFIRFYAGAPLRTAGGHAPYWPPACRRSTSRCENDRRDHALGHHDRRRDSRGLAGGVRAV